MARHCPREHRRRKKNKGRNGKQRGLLTQRKRWPGRYRDPPHRRIKQSIKSSAQTRKTEETKADNSFGTGPYSSAGIRSRIQQ